MKFSIKTAEITKALFRTQGIADKRSTMPILSHVLLDARGGQDTLVVNASDHELGLSGHYDADVSTPGAVAVHAKQLYEIVKAFSTQTVEIEKQDNNWVEIRSGSSRFRLVGMAAEMFPAMPQIGTTRAFTVEPDKLSRMIDRTIFCVSSDDNRHNLNGIYCESPQPYMLRMVATDGHRLAMVTNPVDAESPLSKGVIVPRKAFYELRRILSDASAANETVTLAFADNACTFRVGKVELASRLIDAHFPNYKQVIPQAAGKQIKLSRTAVGDALKRVSLLSQGRAWGVKLLLSKGVLELVAEDPDFGDAHETLEIQYDDGPLNIGFNARYLLDVLGLMAEQGFVFEVADDLSPAVLKPIEDRSFLAVVMPMRF